MGTSKARDAWDEKHTATFVQCIAPPTLRQRGSTMRSEPSHPARLPPRPYCAEAVAADANVSTVFAKECWSERRQPIRRFCVSDEHCERAGWAARQRAGSSHLAGLTCGTHVVCCAQRSAEVQLGASPRGAAAGWPHPPLLCALTHSLTCRRRCPRPHRRANPPGAPGVGGGG